MTLKMTPAQVVQTSKINNANLSTQTCDEWPNGLTTWRKLDASCKKEPFNAVLCMRPLLSVKKKKKY